MLVARVLVYGGQAFVAVPIVIQLRSLECESVCFECFCQAPGFFYLVLVVFHHEKLHFYFGRGGVQLFFPLSKVSDGVDGFAQLSADAILLVSFLRGAVDVDDDFV